MSPPTPGDVSAHSLHLYASSSPGVIKTCVSNRIVERQKVKGENMKVRRVHEEGCLCGRWMVREEKRGRGREGVGAG